MRAPLSLFHLDWPAILIVAGGIIVLVIVVILLLWSVSK